MRAVLRLADAQKVDQRVRLRLGAMSMAAGLETFGKYRLLRRIAFGGMAEIFLAKLVLAGGFEKLMVIKRILPQFGSDPDFVSMFRDEAVLAAKLNHPNLVQVLDYGSCDGVHYMCLEYVDGVDLRTLLRGFKSQQRRLAHAEVAAIGESVARGLSYAHNFCENGVPLGIVHRDISPHNIMVSRAGQVKVMDFGIAKAVERLTRTATGMIKGKVAYMAPEQAAGGKASKYSDQFALGLVLWELLTGERHFSADSEIELLHKVIASDIRAPSCLRPDLPSEIERIVLRALEREPPKRCGDLRDLEAGLAAFRFSLGTEGHARLGERVAEVLSWADRAPDEGSPPRGTRLLPVAAEPEGGGENSKGIRARGALGRGPLGSGPLGSVPTEPLQTSSRVAVSEKSTDVTATTAGSDGAALPPVPGLSGARAGGGWRWLGLVLLPGLLVGGALVWGWLGSAPEEHEEGSLYASVPESPSANVWNQAWVEETPAPPRASESKPDLPAASEALAAASTRQTEVSGAEVSGVEVSGVEVSASESLVSEEAGLISLRSSGAWVDVYLGDRRLGTTPLTEQSVPAGPLTLHLINGQVGIDELLEFDVKPGEHVRYSFIAGGGNVGAAGAGP